MPSEDDELTPEQLKDALRKTREENADRRTKNRELSEQVEEMKKRLDTIDTDKKTAEEEATKKRGEFEQLAQTKAEELAAEKRSNAQKTAAAKKALIQAALRGQVTDLIDPDLVALIDLKGVEVGEDFSITGLDDVVKAFREAKPTLFKAEGTQQTTTTTNRNGVTSANGTRTETGTKQSWADSDKSLDDLVNEHKASLA